MNAQAQTSLGQLANSLKSQFSNVTRGFPEDSQVYKNIGTKEQNFPKYIPEDPNNFLIRHAVGSKEPNYPKYFPEDPNNAPLIGDFLSKKKKLGGLTPNPYFSLL